MYRLAHLKARCTGFKMSHQAVIAAMAARFVGKFVGNSRPSPKTLVTIHPCFVCKMLYWTRLLEIQPVK